MRLRPSMRENYRYTLARVFVKGSIDPKEIYLAASDAYCLLFGEIQASYAWIAVMDYSAPYVIIRFRRGNEQKVEAALAIVASIKGTPAVIHPIKISGTIKTIREEIKKRNFSPSLTGKVKINDDWFSAEILSDRRIDLKEKGINLKIPLYITEEDIKDLYYDE